MDIIRGDDLTYNNGTTDILTHASFRIVEGGRYGLIGPNGAGKTTLLRLILGEEVCDSGSLRSAKGLKTGYVPQKQERDRTQSIGSFLTREADFYASKLIDLEAAMAEREELSSILEEYERVTAEFESWGGYGALEKAERNLKKLGLDNDTSQSMDTLSGGERSIVYFAKALISDPKFLILDEPGNHLDFLGISWLEAFLQKFNGTLLVVSHNRYLLDKVCTGLLHIENGCLTQFSGNYSRYKSEVLRDAVVMRNAFESSRRKKAELQKKIRELQSIAMNQYNPPARIMNQLAAAKRKYAEEESKSLNRPDLSGNPLSLEIAGETSKSDIALRVEGFSLSFGDQQIFDNASLEIQCGERVALVGCNGSGKSSFLKAVMAEGRWDHPHLKIGPGQKIGYLSQVPRFFDGAVTVEDEVRSWGALTRDEAFSLVQNMGFEFWDMDKSLAVLSGGETSRLQLAKFLYTRVNFLILDEPTNHMDIESRESIEEAVDRFEGTILLVSHDRYFLDSLVDRVIEIKEKGFESYAGNFTDFFRNRYPSLPRMAGGIDTRGAQVKRHRGESAHSAEIEKRIEEAEAEKLKLEKELRLCVDTNDRKKGHAASVRHAKLIRLLDSLYGEWESQTG